MKVYIGFSVHTGSLISKAIQVVEDSKFSHVYIRKVSKYGEYVYQASSLAVNFTNINIFKAHNTIIEEYEFELPDDKHDKLITFFIKYAGAGYETKSLFKILAFIIAKRLGCDLKLKGEGTQKFICSELGAFFCEEILDISIDSDLDFTTPKMLNSVVRAHGIQII